MDEDNRETFSCQLAHSRLVSILVNVSVTFENLPVLWPITPLIQFVKSEKLLQMSERLRHNKVMQTIHESVEREQRTEKLETVF